MRLCSLFIVCAAVLLHISALSKSLVYRKRDISSGMSETMDHLYKYTGHFLFCFH